MAGMNPPMNRSAGQRISTAAVSAPRLVMSWEDWLTFGAAFIAFIAVAVSIQQADWVRDPQEMPALVPNAVCALLIGMIAARVRVPSVLVHPVALALGFAVVVLSVQTFADGDSAWLRIQDTKARMEEWIDVVRAGDISNDTLPFVMLVHSVTFLAVYLGSYVIFRWHNPWVALLPASIVLLTNIAFLDGQPSTAFVVFLFAAILLVARLHLQRNQEKWKRAGVEYPDFISLSAIQLTVMVAAGLMVAAWLVPLGTQQKAVEGVYDKVTAPFDNENDTLVRLFHNIDSRKGANFHSFGSTLPIRGDVKLGTKQLYEVKAGEAGLIRGTSYDVYTGAGWKTGDRDAERVDGGELGPSPAVVEYLERTPSILSVTVLDTDGTILSSGMPLGTNRDAVIETPEGYDGDIEQIKSRRGLDNGDTYNTLGSQSKATPEQLRAASTAYPEWVTERYLQLPDDLPERVRTEAALRAQEGANAYDKAALIEAYLRSFPYNLQVPAAPPKTDAVDYFLFELKAGYFDYHASAMVVMLRTLGIPSRLAVGYVLDPKEVTETTYMVRKDDAYSWVEVFVPEYGWIVFNPTPNQPSAADGGGFGSSDFEGDVLDPSTLEGLFGDPNAFPGSEIPPEILGPLTETPVEVEQGTNWMVFVWIAAGVVGVLAVVGAGSQLAWNWGLGGLQGRARLWAKVHRVAGWAGLGSRPEETPREWSRRVGSAIEREGEAVQLASAYEESRYGRPDLQRMSDDQAEGAYKQLRNSLFGRVFRRKDRRKGAKA
ncbi:MAG: DUF4129 domain-containing protein [Dehalococcoidia bacterium]|nr:DUF4129 domain-containing protein [Dehalococcoidia bacterium]